MGQPFVLMHISDLHFHKLPRNPSRYLSKRVLGAANLALRRGRQFPLDRAERLVEALQGQEWCHLVITGDLTQLGWEGEFELARRILAPLLERGAERVTVIPGNHDRYVPEAPGGGAFERYFGEFLPDGEILTRKLTERWWMAAWDSAEPAPWGSAAGRVRPGILAETGRWLAGLPEGARVIIANHYPVFFPPPYRYVASHDLRNQREVSQWLLEQTVDLYLHGHVHRNWVMNVPGGRRPLTAVNSAASTQLPGRGGHSGYHRIVLDDSGFQVEPMTLE